MHIGDFSIRTRLLSGFGLIAALMLAAAAAGSWGLHSIVETTRKAIEGDFRVARLAAEIKMGVGQLRRFEKDVFINIESSEKVASYSQKWQLAMEQTEHARSTAYKLAQDDARGAVDALGGELRAYAEGFRTTLTLISGGTVTTTAQANDVMGKYKTAVYRTEELVDQVHKDANHRAGKVDEVIRERRDSVRVILITLAALSLLIAVSLAIVITRGIAQPLQYAVRIAQRVAAGELGHHIAARGDEIGQLLQALREMDCQLAETIGEVREGAQTVRATASELADSNDHMSQRTQEQASSLEETAASIEEMTASVQANAENAGHASRLARGAREVATAGGETVTKAAEAMEAISNSSRRIADIISVIDEIAFQTNLLALNAAVEAARAGEQGRGFAVVAGEVRNLAQRSAAAAKEIKALIGDSVEKVHAGSKLVEKSGEHLRMIVESIHKVTDVVAEIASASSQQAAGVTQLNDAVSQLDAMTQQNAAATEQISAASKQMFEQSERLAKKTAYFRVRSPGETPAAALSLGRATAAVPGHHPTRADSAPDLELRYGT